jgi:hypothetical protein
VTEQRPPSASFDNSDRYTAPREDEPIQVVVDGAPRDGVVLGLNGPRVQVRFEMDGSTYVRWFDTAELLTD